MNKVSKERASKHSLMRGKNTRLILETFRKGDFSTYQVARRLSLSSGGAKKLVDDIVLGGIISRVPSVRENQHGRMPLTYGLNANFCRIAIINFADYTVSVVDFRGQILGKITLDLPTSIRDEHILETAAQLHGLLDKAKGGVLAAISIAYLGKLHNVTYDNYFSGTFENCTVNLYQFFKKEFGVEIILRNDLHFAILAERQYGILTGGETACCYMQIGRGCACSFLINDQLYVGASGLAGEIGHNILVGSNTIWQNYVDWISAKEKIVAALNAGEPSSLSAGFKRKDAADAYNAGDALVCGIVDDCAKNAGIMLKNLTELMDFDIIILSGPMMSFGDRYYQVLSDSFFEYGYRHVKLVVSTIGEKSIDLGALELARDIVFERFVQSRLSQNDAK